MNAHVATPDAAQAASADTLASTLHDGTAPVLRSHLTLTGTAVASKALLRRLGRAAWLMRLTYNAAVDRHVPFAAGFRYRHAKSPVERAGTAPPAEPERSPTLLPVPDEAELKRAMTVLLDAIPVLREFPRSLFDHAIGDASRARKRQVYDCVAAKAAGRRMPDLGFRSAADGWSVTVDDFMLLRVGTDAAQPRAKRNVKTTSETTKRTRKRNKRRRENDEIWREEAWAAEKRRCGWREEKINARLARRAKRQRTTASARYG